MLGVAVLCAETDERAQWLAGPSALRSSGCARAGPGRYPTPEEAAAHEYTPAERQIIGSWRASQIVGIRRGPARPRRSGRATEADELMVTTMAHHADRLRSYELVADIAAQARPGGPAPEENAAPEESAPGLVGGRGRSS